MHITMYSVSEKRPTAKKPGVLCDDWKRAKEYWLDCGKPGKIWSILFEMVPSSVTEEDTDQ